MCVTLRGVTDTPPRDIPVVFGPAEPPDTTSYMPGGTPVRDAAGAIAPAKRQNTAVVAALAGLGVLVLALGVAIVVLLNRDGTSGHPAAAATQTTTAGAPAAPAVTATLPWSPPPPTDVNAAFGDTLRLSSSAGDEVHYTVTADKVYTKTKYGTKPEKGVLYGIKVLIEVVDGTTYACACDFGLIAADGTAYEGSGYQVSGGLEAVDLNRGQKASGVVVFEIPSGAHAGGKIELREGRGSNQAFWMIP